MKFRARLKFLAALAAAACSSEPTDGGDLLVVSQIDVQPPGATIILGATQQFSATPKTSSGITVPNRPVTWSSSDLGIATVSSGGLVTGIAVGLATISAHVDDVTADVTVNITPKPVASVSVEPPQATLTIGGMQQLLATPRDAQGQALQDRPVTFQSDNPAVASVSVTGVVTAVAVGVTTIRATSEGRTGTSAISVIPRPATRLAFTTQPANGIAGQALPTIRVAVQDEQGGTISDAVTTITLALADNAGGATLSGTTTANSVAGVATFSNVRLDKAGDGYTLRASAVPLTPAVSTPFAITAAAAARLAMVTQPPAAAQSGMPLSVHPVVRILDANGNPVAQAGVEVSVQIVGTGATLAGDLSVPTTANGTATFSDLALTGSGNYSLRFIATGLTEVVSSPISLTSVVATGLVLARPPSSTAQSGVPFAQQPVIQLRDDNNNSVQGAGIPVTASVATGGGTLLGTATVLTDAGGQATFTNLGISGAPGSRTLLFSSPGLTSVASGAITLTAGPAFKLGLSTQPSAAAGVGVAFAQQPVVEIQDAFGNPVATAGIAVTATIESGPAGTLGGTTAVVTSATGQAAFTNLSITGAAGAYTLRFSATGLTHAISTSVTLGGGSPAKLAITTQPSGSAPNDVAFPTQPVIQVTDAGGSPVLSAGVIVTATVATGGGALGGTLTATTDGSGQATFANLKITGAVGTRTLTFSSPPLTSVTSTDVTITAGIATTIVIVTQPPVSVATGAVLTPGPVVDLQDVSGNDVDSAGVAIDVAIASGGGTLGGTTPVATAANGRAAFGDLTITGSPGNRQLQFTHAGLGSATSNNVGVAAGPPATIAVTQEPSAAAANDVPFVQQPIVHVEDAGGNPVSGATVTVSLSGGGTLSGGALSVATDGSGNASFSGLKIVGLAGTKNLQFTVGALAPVASADIALSAGAATAIVLTSSPPSGATENATFGATVELRDSGGNLVAANGVNIAVSIVVESGSGTLSGTTPVATVAGVSSFGDLSINLAGTYHLHFTSGGLPSIDSGQIVVTP